MNDTKLYDLTIPQNNIWLVENFYDDKSINIIAGTLTIKSGFNVEIAKKTINKFFELNDSTRLKFIKKGSKLYQYVEDYEPFDVIVKDISCLSKLEIENLKKDLIATPIDISKTPFNLIILDRKDGTGQIFMQCHHLVTDAWSASLIGSSLATIYESYFNNAYNFEKAPSYIEFILDEQKYLNSDKYIKDEQFWKNYLKDFSNPVYLKSKENLKTDAKRFHKVLDSLTTSKINDFCKKNHLSLYSVFLSAIAIYTHKVTESNDIIIGTPVLNRSNFIQKHITGMFVSTVPVRFKFNENINFVEICKHTALDSMQIFKHQKFPYHTIVKDSSNRENSENLFNIAFSYQNARAKFNSSSYSLDWLPSERIQDEIEFHLLDLNNSGDLEFDIDYLVDVFNEDEIELIYNRILNVILTNITLNQFLSEIQVITEEEKALITETFNNTVTSYPSDETIVGLFSKTVKENPSSKALILGNTFMTYLELDNKSNCIANFLKALGINKNDRIGIAIDKSFELIIAILGIIKCGASYVPLDNNYSDERKEFILNESKVKLVLFDSSFKLNYNSININNIKLLDSSELIDVSTSNSPVCILYTSGTTGNPKGVEIINRNIIKLVKNISYMDFPDDARILQVASTVFDLSLFEIWASLLNGKALCLITKENLLDFKYLKSYIDLNHINIMCITSVLFNQIVANHIEVFENISQILTGGDKISSEHVKILKNTYPKISIYNSYGPTECTSFCTMHKISDCDKEFIPIGKPISNSACYVLNSKNELVPLLCVGELAIGGDGVSNGYINNIQKNEESFINNIFSNKFIGKKLYKTGDLVRQHIDGNIEFIGRKDNQIKIRGYRIELDEIKNVVLNYPGIENCAVVVKEDPYNHSNKHLLLYFVSNEKIELPNLKVFLSRHLQSYMMPSGIMQISELPINTNYKVDITKLPDISLNNRNNLKPSTEVEKNLYYYIKKLLHTDNFGIDDNLFSIGLDSLFAIELSNFINENYNVNISTKAILENNTILNLEEYIKDNAKNGSDDNSYETLDNINPGEKSIYLEWLKDKSNTLYNAPFELKLDKNIDIGLLKESIIKTICNNKNMCSKFELQDTVKKIFCKPKDSFNISVENVSYEKYIQIRNNFSQPFSLHKFPLFRIGIYVTDSEIYVLFDIHHIIFDGSSFVLFMKEISDRYNHFNVIDKTTPISLKVSKQLLEESKNFYLNEFSGDLPINDLPYDKPRGKNRTFNGKHINVPIDKDLYDDINNFLKEHSLTLNNFLQSAFSILMSKYTYSEDITYGFAYSGRENRQIEKEIGMFVKTIPFRLQIDWNKNILAFIYELQRKTLDYIYYSNYSYDSLVRDLDIARVNNRNAIFDVMFVCQNMHIDNFTFGNSIASFAPVPRDTSKFDFTLEIVPNSKSINVNLEFNSDLFNECSMRALLKHFISIVKEMILKCNMQLKDIEMILPEEKKLIVEVFNNNKTIYPNKTVCQVFEEQVLKHPSKKAIVFGNKFLTYEELNKKSNKIARYLIQKGLKPRQVVAIMIDKSIEYLPAAIAVLKCGATYTPIIEDLPDERAKYMMENAKSEFVLTTKQFFRKITDIPEIFIDDQSAYNCLDSSNLNLSCNIDDILHIIYTSGSTGLPKGNMIKNRGMIRLLLNTNYIDYSSSDNMVTSASLTFDISGFELWGAMLYGMTLHILTKEQIMDINYYSNYLINNDITTTFLATPIFHLMVEQNVDMFKNMKSIYVGGETLLPKYTNTIYAKYPKVKVYNAYGPAEITVICCAKLINKIYETDEDIPLGKITSNNTVYVLDKCNKLCPVNVPGELYVCGDGLGLGYVNRPDLTKERFTYINGLDGLSHKSGDLTKWNKNGEIRFITRIDTQVKIRGQRIELSEIQNRMLEFNGVKESVAIVTELNNNKYIIAYYTSNNVTPVELNEYLNKYLPDYMVPYKIIKLDNIPYTHNGKIDRSKLPKITFTEKHVNSEILTAEEVTIINCFKNVLNLEDVYLDSNFFEIGGDSLAVAKLVANLQTNSVFVSYADIFKYPTPLEIYKHVYLNHVNEVMSGKVIKDMDFSQINSLLQCNCYHGEEVKLYNHIGNVLLTGVTGFLGVHILKELTYNSKVDKIYCLVRDKNNISSTERFKKQLEFFFDSMTVNDILKKAIVINGDITENSLFERGFADRIDVIINSAARVQHYGEYNKFYAVNVLSVKNMISYCIKNNTKLVQISTLSVSGNVIESGQTIKQTVDKNTYFDESKISIGQNIDNVYVNTKFAAEVEVLNAIISKGLNAKIIRLGNLTGRLSDGKFQPNVEENAFSNRLKTLISLGAITDQMYEKYLEMTPIDVVSCAINKILEISNSNIIYHLFNHNHILMIFFINILKKLGINISVLKMDEFTKLLHYYMSDSEKLNIVQGIIPDISSDGSLEYNDNIVIKSEITQKMLETLNFRWPKLDEDYILKYLKYLNKIKFINLDLKF